MRASLALLPGQEAAPALDTTAFDAVFRRMKLATGFRTQTELAAFLEIGKAAISDAKGRDVVPAQWLMKLARPPFGVNPLWLETGQGAMRLLDLPDPLRPLAGSSLPPVPPVSPAPSAPAAPTLPFEPPPCDEAGFAAVPLVRGVLCAEGVLASPSTEERSLAFSAAWLARQGDPAAMRLMRMSGDAMRPTLEDGDMLLADTSQTQILEGKVYVLRMDEGVVVRRLGRKPGLVTLSCDNRDVALPLDAPAAAMAALVLGRVVWASRENL